MKIARVCLVAIFALALSSILPAQSVDAFFGLGTVTSPQSDGLPKLSGGLYPVVGADLILFHGLGFGGEVAWRGKQALYLTSGEGGTFEAPVRPLFYDFDLVWEPLPLPRITPVLQLGIGAESLRFYQPVFTCGTFSGCTNYQSSNHLMGHLGAAVRLYVTDHIFVAPEAHLYLIHNNQEFGVTKARRFGISIGYTLRAGPF